MWGQLTINTDGSVQSSLIDITNGNMNADNETLQFVEQLKEEVSGKGNFVTAMWIL